MESNFTSPVHWENEGVEPSTTLKKTGFQGGYKPPASVFNYFFYNNEKCIKELQTAANNLDANKSNLGHTHKYAVSDSAGGAALSSRKLETARKINGVSFDGTQDITIDVTGKTRRYELGPYDSISRYSMFARTSNINTLENCGATLLVTDAGNFGSPQTGAWLIQLSNRESKPTMLVTTLLPHKRGTVNFGYYEDSENGYFYFGAYTGTYRSVFAVTVFEGYKCNAVRFRRHCGRSERLDNGNSENPTGQYRFTKLSSIDRRNADRRFNCAAHKAVSVWNASC